MLQCAYFRTIKLLKDIGNSIYDLFLYYFPKILDCMIIRLCLYMAYSTNIAWKAMTLTFCFILKLYKIWPDDKRERIGFEIFLRLNHVSNSVSLRSPKLLNFVQRSSSPSFTMSKVSKLKYNKIFCGHSCIIELACRLQILWYLWRLV